MLEFSHDPNGNITHIYIDGEELEREGEKEWIATKEIVWDEPITAFPSDHRFELVDGLNGNTVYRDYNLEILFIPHSNTNIELLIEEVFHEESFDEGNPYLHFGAYIALRAEVIEEVFSDQLPLQPNPYEDDDEGHIRFKGQVPSHFYCRDLISLVHKLEEEIDKQVKLRIIETLL